MGKLSSITGRATAFFYGMALATALAACGGSGGGGAAPADDPATSTPPPSSAGITVSPTSGLTTSEAGDTATFTVVLDSRPAADVTIAVSSSDESEGTASPASLTFTTSNWNTPQTVTITGQDDAIDDGDVPYSIILAAAVSPDPDYNGKDPADPAVTNTDDDTAGITVSPTSGLVVDENGNTATFTVKLNSEPTAQVVIAVASSDTNEAAVDKATLTFDSSNWSTAQTVTVTGQQNNHENGNQGVTIQLTVPSSADTVYAALDPDDVSVTNIDLTEPYSVTPMVDSGYGHTLVLASNGTVWGWGSNSHGELCTGDTTPRVYPVPVNGIRKAKQVTAGYYFSLMLKDDGTVWGCGYNAHGELGQNKTTDPLNPPYGETTPGVASALQDAGITASHIAAGATHALAIDENGQVWAWGANTSGQLGDASTTPSTTPVAAAGSVANATVSSLAAGHSASHSVALDGNGHVHTWGSDYSGQLGNGATTGDVATPADISTSGALLNKTITSISSEFESVMALDNTGQVYAWGRNDDYQLGDGSGANQDAPVAVTALTGVRTIYAGHDKGLAIMEADGSIQAWGDNSDDGFGGANRRGQLGTGDTADKTTPTAASGWGTSADSITGGLDFSVTLNSDGSLLSSGENLGGERLGRTTAGDYDSTPGNVIDGGYDSGAAKPSACSSDQKFYANRPVISGYPVGSTTLYGATITVENPAGGDITGYIYQINSGVLQGDPNGIAISTPITIPSPNLDPANTGTNNPTIKVWGIHANGTVDCTPTTVSWFVQ